MILTVKYTAKRRPWGTFSAVKGMSREHMACLRNLSVKTYPIKIPYRILAISVRRPQSDQKIYYKNFSSRTQKNSRFYLLELIIEYIVELEKFPTAQFYRRKSQWYKRSTNILVDCSSLKSKLYTTNIGWSSLTQFTRTGAGTEKSLHSGTSVFAQLFYFHSAIHKVIYIQKVVTATIFFSLNTFLFCQMVESLACESYRDRCLAPPTIFFTSRLII